MLDVSLWEHLPKQWVGIGALLVFGLYVFGQVVEKYEKVAKLLPLGSWWHERQNRKPKSITAQEVASAVEVERKKWELEGHSELVMFEARLQTIAAVSKQQVLDIEELNSMLRAFRAWSGYDARWHNKHEIDNAPNETHITTPHRDFFEFEQVWRVSPTEAVSLT